MPKRQLRRQLAGLILSLRVGDRLPSTRDLAALYGTSLGSVSNALGELEASGAVRISSRGREGSFVLERSVGALWAVAASSPMVIGLTLASNPRNEGLATALKQVLGRAGIEVYFAFIRGSRSRLAVLREGRCHAVVMSCFAADELCQPTEKVLFRLDAGSYAQGNSVYYSKAPVEAPRRMRVAIDYDSYDQTRITQLEFEGRDIELQPAILPQMFRLLALGRVDAAALTRDDMHAHLNGTIAEVPLGERVRTFLDRRDTQAAVVIRSPATDVEASLLAAVDVDRLMQVQQDVLEGRRIAEY